MSAGTLLALSLCTMGDEKSLEGRGLGAFGLATADLEATLDSTAQHSALTLT